MHRVSLATVAAIGLAILLGRAPAGAAEIKLLAGGAVRPALEVLIPEFERSSGHRVVVEYAPIGAQAERVAKGEASDVAIVSPAQIEALQKLGRVAEGSANIAGVGIGLAV